jgi:hypothetical protein
VIAAALRLSVTVDYIKQDDSTYAIGSVMLWCYIELVCVIFVFCVTALPKVVTVWGPKLKLVASYLSLSRWSDTDGASGHQWSAIKDSSRPTASPSIHQLIDERGMPLGELTAVRTRESRSASLSQRPNVHFARSLVTGANESQVTKTA